MSSRWLSIVGIGEDGRSGLGVAANTLIDTADLIIGGERHLELVGETRGEKMRWLAPLEATSKEILARRGTPVVVLVSGDPFYFGAGVTLARSIPIDEMLVVPAPSSLSLAAARLGWALQETTTLGLNMRGLTPLLRRHVHHGRKILALALNGETPKQVAGLLTAAGYGPSKIIVMEALGGPRENIRHTTAEAFTLSDVDPLNVIGIDVLAGPQAEPIPYAPGLPDSYFENDGQLTKREIRTVTLSSLQPCPGELLWDVGVGSGSIGIEWLLAHPSNRAIGLERDETRAARAVRNALALGVPHFEIRRGAAPEALDGLPAPDAVFIGCGTAGGKTIEACWAALKPGGRIVVNSVTLESGLALLAAYHAHGGTLTRLGIERAEVHRQAHGLAPGFARGAVGLAKAGRRRMIAIGIGANSRAGRDDFIAVIASTISTVDGCDVVATLEGTSFSDILEDAANLHDLEFRPFSLAALRQRNGDCITRSDLTLDLLGIASVAEASALAAAGPGSELLTPRRTIGHITIATARSADTKENDR